MNISDVLIKPIVSEKSFSESNRDRYSFKVRRDATKTQVKQAVEKLFGVKVVAVYTANITKSRTKNRRYTRTKIDKSYKKARVKLEKGQKIDIFETKSEKEKDK